MDAKDITEDILRITKRLNELPPLIADTAEKANHGSEIKEMENGLKDMIISLSMEVDDGNKKIYTNQAAREARARELAKDDPYYQQLLTAWNKATDSKKRADILLEKLRLEFSGQKSALFAFTEMLKTKNIELAAMPKVVEVEIHHDAQ